MTAADAAGWTALADKARAAADEWTDRIDTTPPGSTPDPAAAARLCRDNAELYEEQARRSKETS